MVFEALGIDKTTKESTLDEKRRGAIHRTLNNTHSEHLDCEGEPAKEFEREYTERQKRKKFTSNLSVLLLLLSWAV